jgi:hypothetical protein
MERKVRLSAVRPLWCDARFAPGGAYLPELADEPPSDFRFGFGTFGPPLYLLQE